jgi:hypothetical protein
MQHLSYIMMIGGMHSLRCKTAENHDWVRAGFHSQNELWMQKLLLRKKK